MRRRTQRKIVAIDFDAGGAAETETEIADLFLCPDAVEDPGHAAVERIRHALERLTLVHAFRGEADAADLLRRTAARSPQAGFLARGGEIALARIGLPGSRAGIELADLHAMRFALAQARDPVIAIAARIDQPTALAQKILGGIQHL